MGCAGPPVVGLCAFTSAGPASDGKLPGGSAQSGPRLARSPARANLNARDESREPTRTHRAVGRRACAARGRLHRVAGVDRAFVAAGRSSRPRGGLQSLADDDQEGALASAESAEAATARADLHSHTPVWWVSQILPFVGDDITAVRTVSAGAHNLTEGVVTP